MWLDTPEVCGTDNIPLWTPEQRQQAIEMLSWAINRIADAGARGKIETLNADQQGVYLSIQCKTDNRGGSHLRIYEYVIPWEVFLSDLHLYDWRRAQDQACFDAAQKVAQAAKAEADKQQAAVNEKRERELYKILHSKYGSST